MSMNLQEQTNRIKQIMGVDNQDIQPDQKEDENELDFSQSEVKEVVWRIGDIKVNHKQGGIWFSDAKKASENFAYSMTGKELEAKPYHILIKNPYHIENFWRTYIPMVASEGGRETLMKTLSNDGYDGIIIGEDWWNDTGDEYAVRGKQYIVFSEKNVKEA